jgi:SAM-dependent MidA family methyltransferase
MTLAEHIAARIAAQGPLSVAEYMSECLLHPTLGYYTTREPFGTAGDFVTAPEISQMFGELIGLCLAQAWLDQGGAAHFTLAELGPGRGTLMADILRAADRVPGFRAAASIHLLEASPRLRARQAETLSGHDIRFMDSLDELPDAPLFFVANEFFDALPIRQFRRDGAGWRETLVGTQNGRLCFGLGPRVPFPALEHRLADTAEGDIVETAPAAASIAAALGARIAARGGAGLVIDYGDWRSLGDTLQAVRAHQQVDVLEAPGRCDLTAHVDFEAVARSAPCRHTRLATQGAFLERLGITDRARRLAETLSGARRQAHVLAHRRLTHPDEMGNVFKVLGFYPEGMPPPAGLDA